MENIEIKVKTKRSGKRLLATLLVLCLMLSLMPTIALAGTPTRTSVLTITGSTTETDSIATEGWAWYPSGTTYGGVELPANTLVLDGLDMNLPYVYNTSTNYYAIDLSAFTSGTVNVYLAPSSENSIAFVDNNLISSIAAISCPNAALSITGSGSLSITTNMLQGNSSNSTVYGIISKGGLDVTGSTLNITLGSAASYRTGLTLDAIHVSSSGAPNYVGTATITGAAVNLNMAGSAHFQYGINANKVVIDSSTINYTNAGVTTQIVTQHGIMAGDSANDEKYGVYISGSSTRISIAAPKTPTNGSNNYTAILNLASLTGGEVTCYAPVKLGGTAAITGGRLTVQSDLKYDTSNYAGAIAMPRKRANGEGNIRKRKGGRWEGRYTVGHDPDTGKQIFKNVLGRSQTEVKEKLTKAIQDTQGIDVIRAEEYTVAEWVNTWFELYSEPHVRESTALYYQSMIKYHVIPYIGEIKLRKLTAMDVQKLYRDLADHGRVREAQKKTQPGLSSTGVRGVHMMLHNCLDQAVKERLIAFNPTEACKIPKIQKKEMKVLQPDDVSKYLKAAEKRGVLAMFYLELSTGIRKGELTALLWSDLDIEKKTISVSKQAYYNGGEVKIIRPKTANSIRKISIAQEVVDLLVEEHKKHPDSEAMFPSTRTGEMFFPDSVVNLHKKILKDAGLEHFRFHDLRHTFATLALQNGVDVKTVSSMLGHYNAGFTLTTYAHATRQMQEDAAQRMGSFMTQAM